MKPIRHALIAAALLASCTFACAQTADSTSREKPKIGRMPSFKGGDINTFAHWISERLQYPESMANKGTRGRVIIKFIIEKDGSLTFHEIMESPDTVLSRAVVLLALQAPRWKPALLENGDPARCFIVLPVNFVLPDKRNSNRSSRFDKEFQIPSSGRAY